MPPAIALLALYLLKGIDVVQLERATTGKNGVVSIYMSGTRGHYLLACNRDQETCKIPEKDQSYNLVDTPPNLQIYQCQGVSLFIQDNPVQVGSYCLDSVR